MKSSLLVPFLALLASSCFVFVDEGGSTTPPPRIHDHAEPRSHPSPTASDAGAEGLHLATETFTLPNGMTVVFHEDHSLPKVVINTWFGVGSKEEKSGRTGFAHLFEHLMFMGTGRVPGNQFDVIMETGGGYNNASTSENRTNYYSEGPSSLLPTLLWLDADRFAELANHMNQEKLDAQRNIVRNERRQTTENTPYGIARLLLPEALYPEDHPYHHPVIGSHEDLEAATVEDVVEFFRTYYVPGNATLVVAGDFDPVATRELVERLMGAVPAGPVPSPTLAAPVTLEREKRIVATDRVEFPKLYLAWHSPAAREAGDGEMELVASILAGGPSTRLERRLVLETGLAQEVVAFQMSGELGSMFHIQALAAPGVDLEEIEREILDVVDELRRSGPTEEELARVKVQQEARFLSRLESLRRRADLINSYRRSWGVSDGFQRDLDRWLQPTARDVRDVAREYLGEGRVDLRIFPEGAETAGDTLAARPEDFPRSRFTPPEAETFTLSNGVAVHAVPRPGTRLFSGQLVVRGGEVLTAAEQSGLSALVARVMNSGAGGRDAVEFAAAVDGLGASIRAGAGREAFTVSTRGLTSQMDATLDLFADLVLRPNMAEEDFERERSLVLGEIRARKRRVQTVASQVARTLAFGRDDPRGRPVGGYVETVECLALEDVRGSLNLFLHPENASFVFAGDFAVEELREHLERRFGSWEVDAPARAVDLEPRTALERPGTFVVDRPGAPQTMIVLMRPVASEEGLDWTVRDCLTVVLGGTFSSRLNLNLRERNGYSYGARLRISRSAAQQSLTASSAVFTDKTGAALREFHNELALISKAGITVDELGKALESSRTGLIETAATTSSVASNLAGLVANARPLDSAARELAELEDVTLEAANGVAASGLFAWEDLAIVLVGDRATIVEQLAAAGFPEPIEVTPEGDPVE